MKFIALDIGNVLCHVNTNPFLENLSESLNITMAEAFRFMKRFQQLHDLGITTIEDELKDKFNIKSPVTINKLINDWNNAVVPCEPMIDSINMLRERHNLNVALLSNIGTEHAELIEEKLSKGGLYQSAVKHFSCFVGARKPSSIYYQSFLASHSNFYGCIYVDDLPENLKTGREFGFKTFLMNLEERHLIEDNIKQLENLIMKMSDSYIYF